MALVPIIQPPIIRLLTSKKERRIRMPYSQKPVSRIVRVLFPIVVTVLVSLIAPKASPLISTLMFGNLIRESGVVERLSKGAQNELTNLITLFLGLVIGSTLEGQAFIKVQTLAILGLVNVAVPTLGTMLNWAITYQAILLGKWNWIATPIFLSVFLFIALYWMSVSISEYLDPRTRIQRVGA
jgi:oxaloacetate decarboxylase beta subunit